MPTFPTLSVLPIYPLDQEREDSSIRSPLEAGYVHARARWTKERKTWPVKYENMPNADMLLLEAFVDTVKSVTPFAWTHPVSGEYNVRFSSLPKQSLVRHDGSNYIYNYEFSVTEI